MTKVVTAVAVMQLWEQGVFSPTTRYRPTSVFRRAQSRRAAGRRGWGLRPAAREVTVRDLLTMTSGIPYTGDDPAGRGMDELVRRWRAQALAGRPWDTVRVAEEVGRLPLMFDPGSYYNYGFSFDILGALVQVWTGLTLAQYCEKNIFRPLGMRNSGFLPGEAGTVAEMCAFGPDGRLTHADEVGTPSVDAVNWGPPHFFSGGAGMISTLSDYFRFTRARARRHGGRRAPARQPHAAADVRAAPERTAAPRLQPGRLLRFRAQLQLRLRRARHDRAGPRQFGQQRRRMGLVGRARHLDGSRPKGGPVLRLYAPAHARRPRPVHAEAARGHLFFACLNDCNRPACFRARTGRECSGRTRMCAIEAAPKRQPRFFGLYGLREKPGGLAYLAGAGRGRRHRRRRRRGQGQGRGQGAGAGKGAGREQGRGRGRGRETRNRRRRWVRAQARARARAGGAAQARARARAGARGAGQGRRRGGRAGARARTRARAQALGAGAGTGTGAGVFKQKPAYKKEPRGGSLCPAKRPRALSGHKKKTKRRGELLRKHAAFRNAIVAQRLYRARVEPFAGDGDRHCGRAGDVFRSEDPAQALFRGQDAGGANTGADTGAGQGAGARARTRARDAGKGAGAGCGRRHGHGRGRF